VVINCDGQLLLRGILANDILVQVLLQFQRLRELMWRSIRLVVTIVFQDRVAYGDALVTNISSGVIVGGGDSLTDYVLTFMTKRTTQRVVGTSTFHADLRKLKDLHSILKSDAS